MTLLTPDAFENTSSVPVSVLLQGAISVSSLQGGKHSPFDHEGRISSQLDSGPVPHRFSLNLQRKVSQVNERNQRLNMCHNSKKLALFVGNHIVPNPERTVALPALAVPIEEDEEEEHQEDSGFASGGPFLSQGYYKPLSWCADDLHKLQVTMQELEHSCFYWGDMDSNASRRLLRYSQVGTFLVRASSNPRFLYSLSVKTERGATSVRILYEDGLFQFDCDSTIRDQLPRFESVLALVDFYVLLSQEGGNKMWRWEEVSGDKHMKMTLLQPMRSSVPSLAHQARVKVNQCLENVFFPHLSVDKLCISKQAKEFLRAYPYRS